MDGQVLMHTDEVITQEYSSRHKAIDVVGSGYSIDDVVAVSDGTVEIAVNTVTTNNTNARGTASYGNYVKVKHNDGTKSLYAHLKPGSVSVKTGDHISEGDKIGTMGNTGNAHGVHLHFEVRNSNETRMNPKEYFSSKKQEEPAIQKEEEKVITDPSPSEVKPTPPVTKPIPSNENVVTNKVPSVTDDSVDTDSVSDASQGKDYTGNSDISYLDNHNYKYGSIVDGLKGIGIDSSYDYRSLLAEENGISDYHGSYDQNVYLLSLLKQGKLKKA